MPFLSVHWSAHTLSVFLPRPTHLSPACQPYTLTHTHTRAHTLYAYTALHTLSPETYHSFHTLLSAPYPLSALGRKGVDWRPWDRGGQTVEHLGPSPLPGRGPESLLRARP